MSNPTVVAGFWTIPKDPDDDRFYRVNVAQDLTDSGTTIHPSIPIQAIVVGVTVTAAPTFVGADITVKLSGLDVSANPVNFCTFRITCANLEVFDRTIKFVREDH